MTSTLLVYHCPFFFALSIFLSSSRHFTMANGGTIAYNVAVFISTLFLLEFGADKFVDHTAIVARRTGIPDTVIALLTAGAEWEEVPLKPNSSSVSA
jgi:Ca2+/Na+ antiporter